MTMTFIATLGKKLTTHEFEKIYAIVSSWTNAEIESGDPVFELCQESILKRGMIILREDIKEKHGKTLLNKLADVWVRFYGNLLPMLQIIFHMMTSRGLNIRLLTLQNFRDVVLLKTEAKEAISAYPHDVPSPVRQMLLVLLVSCKRAVLITGYVLLRFFHFLKRFELYRIRLSRGCHLIFHSISECA